MKPAGQVQKNTREQLVIGLASEWWRISDVSFINQSQGVVKQNQTGSNTLE